MKIGCLSDTHLKERIPDLAELLTGPFRDVEMILHAGDITEMEVLAAFPGGKLLAVYGNMDSPAVRRQLPARRVFQAGNFKIGLIHGWGGPRGVEERVAREFEGVDCIVYGHTHIPSFGERDGIFFFNPGTFGGSWAAASRTVGVLTVDERIAGEIIEGL